VRVSEWEALGHRLTLAGHDLFVIDLPAQHERSEPALILHGYPSSSYDWHLVAPGIAHDRRVIALDFPGFGFSAKPADHRYSLFEYADVAAECVAKLGVEQCAVLAHDLGTSVSGELLARWLEGALTFSVTQRVITNGSIYMDLVQLSAGQQLLLQLPDEVIPKESAPTRDVLRESLAATCAIRPPEEELDAWWETISRENGHRLLARTIRYIEERRIHESRWTGAIERHPSPLTIVWGDRDPIAVYAMAERLAGRSDAELVRLDGVGHYPMIESPERFSESVVSALAP
jgi:pimeloyl-ACP methyl ester carboxylesterase